LTLSIGRFLLTKDAALKHLIHAHLANGINCPSMQSFSLFGWLVADVWCWFVLREEYCWLVAGG
jgi:hypothetical protein